MSTFAKVNLGLRAFFQSLAPVEGGPMLPVAVAKSFSNGTGSWQITDAAQKQYSLAGSATQVLDLQAVTDPDGVACTFVEMRAIIVEVSGANVTFEQGATNPYAGLINGTTDAIVIPAGSTYVILTPTDGSNVVSASAKDMLFTNLSSTATATVTVTLLGCNA